jgi:tetratricopeptide (TPR) repeat protein
MDTRTLSENLPETAREALQPSVRGARLRRRIVAVGGFALLVAGFLVAIGAGKLVLLVLALAAVGILALIVTNRLRAGAHRPVLKNVGAATRKPMQGIRERRAASQSRAEDGRRAEQANRLNARGAELRRANEAAAAVEAHRAALELVRTVDDPSGEALTLNNLALALGHAGEEQEAIERFDEAAEILRRIGDDHHEGQVLANLGLLHGRSGRQEQAVFCLDAALGKLDQRSAAFRRVEEQLRRAS